MESYCSLCSFKVPQGANNLILCTLDTIHRLFFVTRLMINKINKVQWVDFKLENVLVSLHSLKQWAPLSLRNGELLGHSPLHNSSDHDTIGVIGGITLTTDILDVALLCIIFFCSLIKFINHVFVLDKIKCNQNRREEKI